MKLLVIIFLFDQTKKKITSIFEGPCQTSQYHDPMTAGEIKLGDLFTKNPKNRFFPFGKIVNSGCTWSHRWADLSCYHILHGWDSIECNLIYNFPSVILQFKDSHRIRLSKLQWSSAWKKFLCYLKAVPFFYFDPKLTKNWFLLSFIVSHN